MASIRGVVDVGHQREARQPLLELAHPLEVRRLVPIEVDDRYADGFAIADADVFAAALVADMPARPAEQERIVAANRAGKAGALA